jgi:ketosteroid isomerase-like protein
MNRGVHGAVAALVLLAAEIWRRQKDGQWKCVIDIWNDVSPPPQ